MQKDQVMLIVKKDGRLEYNESNKSKQCLFSGDQRQSVTETIVMCIEGRKTSS